MAGLHNNERLGIMKKQLLAIVTLVASISFSTAGIAGTIGTLSWDEASTYITDSANTSTRYVQLGLYANLTYAETISALSTTVELQGFQIATNSDAYNFFNAFSSSSLVDNTLMLDEVHNVTTSWTDGVLGNNHSVDHDFAFFLSDSTSDPVGVIDFSVNSILDEAYGSIGTSDQFSSNGNLSNLPISWLLVNNNFITATVPLPATLFMFIPVLLGVFGFQRKRQS